MIIEENLLGWNNIPVKSKEVIYPQSKDDKAPKNYFLGIFAKKTIMQYNYQNYNVPKRQETILFYT